MDKPVKITLVVAGVVVVLAVAVMFVMKPNAAQSADPRSTNFDAVPPPSGASTPAAELPGQMEGFELSSGPQSPPGK